MVANPRTLNHRNENAKEGKEVREKKSRPTGNGI